MEDRLCSIDTLAKGCPESNSAATVHARHEDAVSIRPPGRCAHEVAAAEERAHVDGAPARRTAAPSCRGCRRRAASPRCSARCQSGCPVGSGSGSVTSRPAPPSRPDSSASTQRIGVDEPPRATFTSTAPGASARVGRPISRCDACVSAAATNTTSARQRFVQPVGGHGPRRASTRLRAAAARPSVARRTGPAAA